MVGVPDPPVDGRAYSLCAPRQRGCRLSLGFDHATLKARQRELRHAFPESLGLRVHCALSWLYRAEQEPDDYDARFIFLWIAFNAA